MEFSQFKILFAPIVFLNFLILEAQGQVHEPCPKGWISYDKEVPYTCLWVSENTEENVANAQISCGRTNSSLMMIQSNLKYEFFKELAQRGKFWIGYIMKEADRTPYWLTKDGDLPVTTAADALNDFYGHLYLHRTNFANGYQYSSEGLSLPSSYRSYSSARYICENQAICKKGWFGLGCDKECHCYGEDCQSTAFVCPYGCKLGWMGKSCSHRKEDADVSFYCANSPDQGKYAHVVINTKGVNYENIGAVNDEGEWVPWCNDTMIETDMAPRLEFIKIYVGDTTNQMEEGECAGKMKDHEHYQWRIKIQEKDGVVSRHDQELQLECDFTTADTFSMSANSAVKREKWFRRADIKRPVVYLDEEKENVDLQVVNPFTGQSVAKAQIGSSVALKIRYDLTEGNQATGVIPYNCDASTPDNAKKVQVLDSNGCPLDGSPISAFSEGSEAKSLVTEPFPLFGFDGNRQLEFHCSYRLCFGGLDCLAGCNFNSSSISSRHRRSTEERVTGGVEVIPRNENDGPAAENEFRVSQRSGSAKSSTISLYLVTVAMATTAFLW